MITRLKVWLSAAVLLVPLAPAAAAAGPELKLERVVMLMRHGVRSPTKAQPVPAQYSATAWPQWSVGPGLLTQRGSQGVALLGVSDRAHFAASGLLPATACPADGDVTVLASKVLRAIDTAKAWTASFAPGCGLVVEHPARRAPDALFHPLEGEPAWFDGRRAYRGALAQAPNGGLARQMRELTPQMRLLERALGCAAPACDLEHQATTLVERPHSKPSLKGPLPIASTASETILLEYLENMPMGEVGWGRASRAEIERLLVFNAVAFDYVERPYPIARAAAGPLARNILQALRKTAGPRITLLAGHDTNIADLGGLLGLHWQAASYPADTVPPGSALGFELLSDAKGRHYVRAFFRSQTMDQLRNLEPLNAANPLYRGYIDIPGCGRAADASSCDLPTLARIIEDRLR
ncbi:MAG: histidine-type phosphatase [Sphingomicrobium sp.]